MTVTFFFIIIAEFLSGVQLNVNGENELTVKFVGKWGYRLNTVTLVFC